MEAFLRPYAQSTPFCVDLTEVVSANNMALAYVCTYHRKQKVRIMCQFNARLEKVGWLDRAFLAIHRVELDNARERFYTFLEMVLCPENGPVAASLDVDLVWHTMQLAGPLYRYAF